LITNGPLREEWAEYNKEPVLTHEMKLYVKTGGAKLEQLKKVKTIEDLRPFSLIDHRGSGWAKKNLVDKNFDVYMITDQKVMYNLLVKGRWDANINCSHVARYIIQSIGLQDQITELDVFFEKLPFHLVVGKKSPFIKIIPKFDQIIKQMKEDGSLEKIFNKYDLDYL